MSGYLRGNLVKTVTVAALIGYHYYHPNECLGDYFVTLTDSGWSDTQTITIGNNTATSTT
jgi:hypothetical protein